MLDSKRGRTESPNPYRTDTTSGYIRGERTECELCGETRRCLDRFGMVTCRACQRDFLP